MLILLVMTTLRTVPSTMTTTSVPTTLVHHVDVLLMTTCSLPSQKMTHQLRKVSLTYHQTVPVTTLQWGAAQQTSRQQSTLSRVLSSLVFLTEMVSGVQWGVSTQPPGRRDCRATTTRRMCWLGPSTDGNWGHWTRRSLSPVTKTTLVLTSTVTRATSISLPSYATELFVVLSPTTTAWTSSSALSLRSTSRGQTKGE